MQDLVITYSLLGEGKDSEAYYQKVKDVADEIKPLLKHAFGQEVTSYRQYIEAFGIEEVRQEVEYELELWMMGLFWKTYTDKAAALKASIAKKLHSVAVLRRKSQKTKPLWSYLKGRLTEYYLCRPKNKAKTVELCTLEQLLNWMRATGEYDEEWERLYSWEQYLMSQEKLAQEKFQNKVIKWAEILEQKAASALGVYVKWVEAFRESHKEAYRGREDQLFCLQPTAFYVFNMVGAQLLNEVYRKDFSHTEKKVIFLPGCMTAHKKDACQAKESHGAYKCQSCTKNCSGNQIQQMASLFQAETIILYHESSLNGQKVTEEEGKVGVIGVACVLNLVSGGFKARRLGYVPQCVLLDYCGCSQHWSKVRLVTQLNQTQLKTILSR